MKLFSIGIAIVFLSTVHLSYQEHEYFLNGIQAIAVQVLETGSNSFAARFLSILYETVNNVLMYYECKYDDAFYCEADQLVAVFEASYVVFSTLAGGNPKFGMMNEFGYALYKEVDRKEHRKSALWARELAKKGLLYRLAYDNSNEFHPFEPKKWKSTDPNFKIPVVRLGKVKPFFFESYPKMQKKYKIFGPPDVDSKEFKKALMEIYEKGESSFVNASQKRKDAVNLWGNDGSGVRIINVMALAIFNNLNPIMSMKDFAKAMYVINVAMHDAYHFAFFVKHKYELNRPRYFISKGISIKKDKNWRPFVESDTSPDYIDSYGSFFTGLKCIKLFLDKDEVSVSYDSARLKKVFKFKNFAEIAETIEFTDIYAGSNMRFSLGGLQKEYEKMGSDVYYYMKEYYDY